jgi:hypothetical protein
MTAGGESDRGFAKKINSRQRSLLFVPQRYPFFLVDDCEIAVTETRDSAIFFPLLSLCKLFLPSFFPYKRRQAGWLRVPLLVLLKSQAR